MIAMCKPRIFDGIILLLKKVVEPKVGPRKPLLKLFCFVFFLQLTNFVALSSLQARVRMQNDLKATKTIAMTIAAFFLCYIPVVAYAIVPKIDESRTNFWFSHLAKLVLHFSTVVNPIIYFRRTPTFQCALKQFLKSPLGRGDFIVKPRIKIQRGGAMPVNANQTMSFNRKWRRNGIAVSPIQIQKADLQGTEVDQSGKEATEKCVKLRQFPSGFNSTGQFPLPDSSSGSSHTSQLEVERVDDCKSLPQIQKIEGPSSTEVSIVMKRETPLSEGQFKEKRESPM